MDSEKDLLIVKRRNNPPMAISRLVSRDEIKHANFDIVAHVKRKMMQELFKDKNKKR